MALALLLWGLGEGLFLYIQPLHLEELGADSVRIGTVLAAAGIARALAFIPSGALADRFFAAIEAGDLDTVRDCYTEDAEIWINAAGRTADRDANLKLLAHFTNKLADRSYRILERRFFDGGFVQRHVLGGRTGAGETIEAQVCLVIHTRDGRIAKLFEYMDPAEVAPAFA